MNDIAQIALMGWGSRIRAARKIAKISQTTLGAAVGGAGGGQSRISSWENEEHEPTLQNFVQIGEITGVSPAWIAFGIGEPTQDAGASTFEIGLDREQLFRVIMWLERYIARKKLPLSIEKKARLILASYDIFQMFPDLDAFSHEIDRLIASEKRD